MKNLIQSIHKELRDKQEGHHNRVVGFLNKYVEEEHKDWEDYKIFAPCKYARNLVEINDEFEAIVLCWDTNQESPIHNHTVSFFSLKLSLSMTDIFF